ncbi:M81 family metallopeptidase [Microvirga sp. 0TCS3.31]
MRLFVASLATETNTFSPIPTTRRSFETGAYFPAGTHPDRITHSTAPLWVARQRARSEGYTLIEGSCFWADPAGLCGQADYESVRDEILDQLRTALPVDGVLLGLHGAMVAHRYADCEGDLITRIREIVGSQVKIGVELDPHCHLTEQCVSQADVIVLFKEYPHTDYAERAEELLDILLSSIRGTIHPVMSLYDCRMIERIPTSRSPGRDFVDRMKALEGKNDVLSISLAHGFQLGDVADMGCRILVVTDGDKPYGEALAKQLGESFRNQRGQFAAPSMTFDAVLEQALNDPEPGPYVIADPTDNAGGGSASDNTNLLRRMISANIQRAAFGPIWDPVAVEFCLGAGIGATLPLRFGGKAAATSGVPIDADVEVIGIVRNGMQSFGDSKVSIGDAVGIRLGGIEVSLLSTRSQAIGLEVFTSVGIDLPSKKIICLKSTNHFYAAYAPIARAVLYTDGGGPSPLDISRLPYRNIERPLWPLDPLPPGRLLV